MILQGVALAVLTWAITVGIGVCVGVKAFQAL